MVLRNVVGRVKVTVSVSRMPYGPQPFSLVVRGGFKEGLPYTDAKENKAAPASALSPMTIGLIAGASGLVALMAAVVYKRGRGEGSARGSAPAHPQSVVVMEEDVRYG